MEGFINEQQRKENNDRYKQHPTKHNTQKTKKGNCRKPRATADILQQMVLREEERVMYRRMSAALKPQQLSTSMAIAPNEHNEWTESTTKEDTEKALIAHHFRNTVSPTTHPQCVCQSNKNSVLTA